MHVPSESRDETDLALVDRLERVGAAETAGNGSAYTDTLTQAVDQAGIPAGSIWVRIVVLDGGCIFRL